MFELRHLAVVRFVVVPGEVKDAVEDQNLEFLCDVMIQASGVGGSDIRANNDVAGEVARDLRKSGKAQDIGGRVFATKLAVERLHAAAGDDEDVNVAADAGGTACVGNEALQRCFGNAVQFGFDRDHNTVLSAECSVLRKTQLSTEHFALSTKE